MEHVKADHVEMLEISLTKGLLLRASAERSQCCSPGWIYQRDEYVV